MTDFKWRVLVLDDNPDDSRTLQQALTAQNLLVSTIDKSQGFYDRAGLDAVLSSHIALVDMQWNNFPNDEIELPRSLPLGDDGAVSSLDDRADGYAVFAQKWVEALGAWSGSREKELVQAHGKWPRERINPDDVGLWLAALVSHLNPECEIILHSGISSLLNRGYLAALGRFRDPQYAVATKPSSGSTDLDTLLPALRRVQGRHIEANKGFREWFIGSVLVCGLLDVAPRTGRMWALGPSGTPCEMTLTAETLFPRAAGDGTSGRDELRELLRRPELLPREVLALESLLHDLDDQHLTRLRDVATAEALANYVRARCLAAGDVTRALMDALEGARTCSDLQCHSEVLRKVWRRAFSRLLSAHYAIHDLCQEFGGDMSPDPGPWPRATDEATRKPTRTHYRGDVERLKRLVEALHVNATNNACNEGKPMFRLDAEVTDSHIVVTWKDSSRGFADAEAFKAAVEKSVEKGSDRGLPCVLASALELGATEVSVWLQQEWLPIIGRSPNETLPSPWRFGVRIALPRPSGGAA